MKKVIREVKGGIVQVTVADERWYWKAVEDKTIPEVTNKFVPSVTWIAGYYPKGIAFYKWLADKGWDEAEAIKSAAGDKGSKVHAAIEDLIDGKDVPMDAKYLNHSTEQEEELKLEEYGAIMSFADWFKNVNPQIIAKEAVVFSDKYDYAGTVDFICKIDGQNWLIDFKTSQNIWPEHELQVSAYKHAIPENKELQKLIDGELKLAILQLGYRRNKANFKFTEVEDKFDLFLSAQQIWKNENDGVKPSVKDYPLKLSLGLDNKSKKTNKNEDK